MKAKPLPSQSLLLERLSYTPETGALVWIKPLTQSRVKPGTSWGSVTTLCDGSNSTKQHIHGRFNGSYYYAHRLIWCMVTGNDPGKMRVDHIDNDGLNNRWSNLRLATHGQNVENQQGHKRRKTPFKGVYRLKNGKWVGQVRRNGILYCTGRVGSAEEAKAWLDGLKKDLNNQ